MDESLEQEATSKDIDDEGGGAVHGRGATEPSVERMRLTAKLASRTGGDSGKRFWAVDWNVGMACAQTFQDEPVDPAHPIGGVVHFEIKNERNTATDAYVNAPNAQLRLFIIVVR
jgi:hypothetical protein